MLRLHITLLPGKLLDKSSSCLWHHLVLVATFFFWPCRTSSVMLPQRWRVTRMSLKVLSPQRSISLFLGEKGLQVHRVAEGGCDNPARSPPLISRGALFHFWIPIASIPRECLLDLAEKILVTYNVRYYWNGCSRFQSGLIWRLQVGLTCKKKSIKKTVEHNSWENPLFFSQKTFLKGELLSLSPIVSYTKYIPSNVWIHFVQKAVTRDYTKW